METPKTNAAAVMAVAEQNAGPLYNECQRLERQVTALVDALTECAGYLASVRTDRRVKDEFGDVFAAQTVEWAEGAAPIAERANSVLEAYDEGISEREAWEDKR